MSARRPLLTSLGATTLLAALWFVPSANATAPQAPVGASGRSGAPASANTGTVSDASGASGATAEFDAGDGGATGSGADTDATFASASGSDSGSGAGSADGSAVGPDAGSADGSAAVALSLADTGGIDTTPYVLGGTLCLGLGAGFVAFSVRRSREG
ncbi:LPXTG cell wall anchor domain-containing protein [Streptomyces sp. NPDC048606]|uniref:LPXTG cell wall anchor domain-containing protein n=1 Tax=Streptomyces sp. NPDC048606 TaxID=3154726 RepID=UPI003415F7C2